MSDIVLVDQYVFHLLNGTWRAEGLDLILPYWREKTFWVPLYVVLAGLLYYRYRRRALYLLLFVGLTITVADQLSSSVIKPAVARLRPCRTEGLEPPVYNIVTCGGGYSFPSSHAANHFALSALLFFSWGRRWGRWRWLLWLWAASVAYAQVYVGVHFPVDVLAGALLGTAIGLGLATLYKRWPAARIDEFYASLRPRR